MDGVYVSDFGGTDNLGNIEIAFGAARGADADGFVGKTDVERVAIRFGVHGDRAEAQLFARRENAECNLTTISNKDLLEHGLRKAAAFTASCRWCECRKAAPRILQDDRFRRICGRPRLKRPLRFRS